MDETLWPGGRSVPLTESENARVQLTDLIDLEAQIVIDEKADFADLGRRDRAIYTALSPEDRTDRGRLLSAWLAALRRDHHGSRLGESVMTGHRLLGYGLLVLGAGAGAGLAGALLFYDGKVPVNVNGFLLGIVGVQLALLLGTAISWAVVKYWPNMPLARDVRAMLRFLASVFEPAVDRVGRGLPQATRQRWQVARSRLRTRAGLYRGIETWVLIERSQMFGVAFNVGVLAVCLRQIFFSDLAFGWSTTGDALSTSTMYRLVQTLSWPWSAMFPDAVPNLELVTQSRFSRLQGGFTGGATDALVGQWWRFLVAAVVTYGLFPRMGLWIAARLLRARAVAGVPLNTPDIERIVRRMEAPRVETRAEADPPPNEASRTVDIEPMARPSAGEGPRGCLVVRWRQVPIAGDALAPSLKATFGYRADHVIDAGAVDTTVDESSWLAAAQNESPIVVVAEAWEAPDKGLQRYLRGLRSSVEADRPIYVALVGEGPAQSVTAALSTDIELWRNRLTLLEDPYLGVEALEPV